MRKYFRLTMVLAAALAAGIIKANAEPLQIKGRQLGQPSAQACQGASDAVKRLDDLVIELKPKYPALKTLNSTSCEVDIETFAGQDIDGPVQMLFVDDRLIQLKFSMKPLNWTQAGDLYTAVEQSYGKTSPFKRDPKTGFTTRTWQQGGQILLLSRPKSRDVEWMDIEVVMRDVQRYKAFTNTYQFNTSVIDRAEALRSKNDTK